MAMDDSPFPWPFFSFVEVRELQRAQLQCYAFVRLRRLRPDLVDLDFGTSMVRLGAGKIWMCLKMVSTPKPNG